MSILRGYQSEIIDNFNRMAAGDIWSVLLTAPTVSRKMVIASARMPTSVAAGPCRERRRQ